MELNKVGYLYFVTFIVNLGSVVLGAAFTWPSPVLPKLRMPDNPLGRPITITEESWLVSLNTMAAIFSPPIASILADSVGRKITQLLLIVPAIFGHLILAFSHQIELFYFARILISISVGGVLVITPLFIAEIAEVRNRGTLGCLMLVFNTLGNLTSYFIGPFVSLQIFSFINVIPPLGFFVMFLIFVPESPYYLASIGKRDEAQKSLEILRGNKGALIKKELEEIFKTVEELGNVKVVSIKEYFTKSSLKGLLITCGLITFIQFSGIVAVVGYLQTIFEATGTSISPKIATMIVGVVQFISSFVTSTLVERAGRKILLIISLSGIVLSHSGLALFFQLKELNFNVSSIFWLPIVSLMLYNIFFSLGLGSLPWTMLGELFTPKVKAKASMIVTCLNFILSTFITLYFPGFLVTFGFAMCFWLFSVICGIGILFTILIVPETKGKTFIEIQKMLNK